MCCYPVYSGRQTCARTSRGHTGGRLNMIYPPSFSALIFIARHLRKIQRSLSLVDREAKSRILCNHELIVLHLLGIYWYIFILYIYFCKEKSPFLCSRFFLFLFFFFCLFGDVAFSEHFLYHFRFLFVWRVVRRTFFPSGWCFFSTL